MIYKIEKYTLFLKDFNYIYRMIKKLDFIILYKKYLLSMILYDLF